MPEQIQQNGSVRCYYKVALNPNAAERAAEAKTQGITNSIFAHEPPVMRIAPDKSYALLRVHWPAGGQGRALFEGKPHVSPITDLEAAGLVASWVKA